MTINTTAKTKIYVGTTATFTDVTGYSGDTYTEIGETENLGTWGAEGKEISFISINDGYARKLKGSIDSGKIDLVCARDPADAGQTLLRTAANSLSAYNFKVVLTDAPTGGTPTTYYFSGPVLSAKNNFGGADDVIKTTFTISISGQIIEVPAAAHA